ncbi:hypothetical protein CH301_28365 [Rhodococcus sp. 15-1189-1-1a]|nr:MULTISPECIES: hypothetical protein [unclassified Rhodococcus (in: high G+C Gram-positive bacteria)]OZE92924.1 hypothetical protein CH301_28365 [Rhodococcus sp. 15-1189-1-1a]
MVVVVVVVVVVVGETVVVLGTSVGVTQGSEVVGALSAETTSGGVDKGGGGVADGCAYAEVDPDASKSAMVPTVTKDPAL